MRRLIFEAEHETFRASARRFFQTEVAPHGERWRQVGQVDREAYLKAGEQGFLLMWAGEEYGGAGVEDFRFEQVLIEENIRFGDPGFFMSLHSRLVGPYLGTLGTAEQKRRFLPSCVSGESILAIAMTEPGAGSDLAGMKTRAVLQGDHWVLDGSKTYISNGQLADLVVVAARTSEARHGIGLFIIERGMPGFERGRHLKKIGLHGQDTSELFFHGVKVPAGNVLGDPGRGFHALTHFLAEERLLGAVTYIANAQLAWDLTLEWARERRLFGKPLGAFQNTRFKLAELRAAIDTTQTFVDACVMEHLAGRLDASLAAEAKLVASELEFRAADECLQLFGGAGYMEEYRIARLFTDARISRIYAGSSEVMKEIIARGFGLDDRKLV
ncbi:MAG: acyl-CoA dehydrogenase family protein [Steroidobacteraceae bacterium]